MSTLKLGKIENLGGIEQYLCKAWVNFNGTGTVTIRAAGNVSSITDNGTGDYTINFTNAMPDTNYAPIFYAGEANISFMISTILPVNKTAGSVRYQAFNNDAGSVATDSSQCNVIVFR